MGYIASINGGNQMLKSLNFDRFGLELTRQLGDLLCEHIENPTNIRYSGKIRYTLDIAPYDDNEITPLYVRGFNGKLASHFNEKIILTMYLRFWIKFLFSHILIFPSQ